MEAASITVICIVVYLAMGCLSLYLTVKDCNKSYNGPPSIEETIFSFYFWFLYLLVEGPRMLRDWMFRRTNR